MIDYRHPARTTPTPATGPAVLRQGDTVTLTGPRAGTITRA